MNISINLITNESFEKVEEAVKSFQFADEVILVDTGSKDNLKDLPYENVRYYKSWFRNWFVFHKWLWKKQRWLFFFDRARNFAISKSTKQWILILDTDERINPKQVEKLITDPKYADADAWRFLQISNNVAGDKIPCNTTRLWRNGLGIKYSKIVHETVDDYIEEKHIKFGDSDARIEHFGYTDPIENKKRAQRVIDALEYENHIYKNYNLAVAYVQLQDFETAIEYLNKAIQDKMPYNIMAHAHAILGDIYRQYGAFYYKLGHERLQSSLKICPEQNLSHLVLKDLYAEIGERKLMRKEIKEIKERDTTKTKMHADILLNKEQAAKLCLA